MNWKFFNILMQVFQRHAYKEAGAAFLQNDSNKTMFLKLEKSNFRSFIENTEKYIFKRCTNLYSK